LWWSFKSKQLGEELLGTGIGMSSMKSKKKYSRSRSLGVTLAGIKAAVLL
jgi:hypothetical protein